MKLSSLALAFTLSLTVACGGKKSAPTGPTPPAGPVATLKELHNGDRACYVVLTTDTGEEQSIEGDFELCPGGGKDASSLVGQRVTWTTEKANVLAAECEGNMDCGKSDEVDLITTINAGP